MNVEDDVRGIEFPHLFKLVGAQDDMSENRGTQDVVAGVVEINGRAEGAHDGGGED